MRVVIVPGINGSDADHWQSHWERSSSGWKRIAPASWDEPKSTTGLQRWTRRWEIANPSW